MPVASPVPIRRFLVLPVLLLAAAPARAAAPSADLVLRLQRMLDAGCGVPVALDGAFGAQTRAALDACRRRLGLPASATATVDSAAIAAFLDAAWGLKLGTILRRQLGVPEGGDPQAMLQRYRTAPPGGSLAARCLDLGWPDDSLDVYLQVFKREQVLEVHARRRATAGPYGFVKAFPLTASPFAYPDSARWRHATSPVRWAGPKTVEGDGRVPEGCYDLVWANRWSEYHLSFGISYPNGADLARRRAWGVSDPPGGAIAVHGGLASDGCIAIGNVAVEELYLFLLANGVADGRYGRIDIFPCRFGEAAAALDYYGRYRPELRPLWASLRRVQEHFARTARVPAVTWDRQGAYRLTAP